MSERQRASQQALPAAMTRRTVAAVLGLLMVLAGAGCGVPEQSEPVRVGAPRKAAGQPATQRTLPEPDGTRNPIQFLRRYLTASAWSNWDAVKGAKATSEASEQVKKFLDPDSPGIREWQASEELKLVRVTYAPIAEPVTFPVAVHATVEDIGTLNGEGSVIDDPTHKVVNKVFTVVDIGDGRLRLQNPLQGLVFDVDQLSEWYQPRTIYFWSAGPTPDTLIPDVRYLPSVAGPDQTPNEILRWLKGGPADWLKPAAESVPDNIEISDNAVVGADNRVTINLSNQAARLDSPVFERYYIQARWSLNNTLDSSVDVALQVLGRTKTVNVSEDRYRSANAAVAAQDRRENRREDRAPPSYCVRDGQVRPAKTQPVPLLDEEHNRNVVRAAIVETRRIVAYVRQDGAGTSKPQQRLVIATIPASGSDTVQPVYAVSGGYASIERLVPLPQNNGKFLVIAGGQPYIASAVEGVVAMTPLAGGERMSAIAVAPDGRRVAYIRTSDNRVLLATLRVEAPDQYSLALPRREIRTTLAKQHAVGWLTQDLLAVGGKAAGTPGRDSPLVEVSVDGTRPQTIKRSLLDAGLEITGLAAVADRPTTGQPRYLMMLEAANNTSYDVFGTELRPLLCNPPSGPAPSQAPTQNVAPFFEG